MKFIRSTKKIIPKQPNGKSIVYMHAYGGRLWHAARHLKALRNHGYTIYALDFTDILRTHNPQELIDLMDEVAVYLEKEQLIHKNTIMVGVSLGGLVGFNMTKRYQILDKLLVVTGGDITHLLTARSLRNKWKLTRQELTERWQDVNMYTPPGTVRDKHIIMLLPRRDKVIDPNEVMDEITKLDQHNNVTLVSVPGGHLRTIITQTVLFPKKSLPHIRHLEQF